jgi:hypothetical protein
MISMRRPGLALVAAALFLLPGSAKAQSGMLGFGYVTNAPQELVGGTIWGLIPGLSGWGLYADAKLNPSDRSTDEFYFKDLSPADVDELYPRDKELKSEEIWRSFDVAVVRHITPELMLYVGGGYAYRDVYLRYLDPAQQRGQFGHYWIKDEEHSEGTVNVMGGALLRISNRLRLQFGGETAPTGFTVGASIVLGGE